MVSVLAPTTPSDTDKLANCLDVWLEKLVRYLKFYKILITQNVQNLPIAAILTEGGFIIAQSPWLFSELGFELPSASRSGSYFINLFLKTL